MGYSKLVVGTGRWVMVILLFGISTNLYAQETSVQGTVIDANSSETLPGVNILVKETSIGVSTDAEGSYELQVPSLNDTLVVSFVGYQTQEIPINGREEINIELVSQAIEGEEMVVTALGMMSQRRSLGYATTSINTDEIENFGSSLNTMTALRGASPGLQITSTALGPSGGLAVRVRNAIALDQNSSSRPLFVVDGIPVLDEDTDINRSTGTGLNDLNMDDIESMEILRGAKAAVLYGSEGANGVILINTKSGAEARGIGVEIGQEMSFEVPVVMQEFQDEFGTGHPAHWLSEVGQIDEEGFYITDGQQSYFPTSLSFGPKMDGREIRWWDGEMRSYSPQPDNYRDLFEMGSTAKTNFSVEGGGEMGSFRFSYTNRNYNGIHEGYEVLQHNVNLSGNLSLSDRINLQLSSSYANAFNRNSPARLQDAFVTYGINRDLKLDLWSSRIVDEENDNYFWWNSDRRNEYNVHEFSLVDGLAQSYYWNQQVNRYENTRDHFTQSVTIDIELSDNLGFQALGGFDWINNNREVESHLTRSLTEGTGGSYQNSLGKEMSLYTQGMLRYIAQLSKDFSLEVFTGGVYRMRNEVNQSRQTQGGFITRDWFSINNTVDDPQSSGSRGSDILFGVLGSAELSYKDWLYLEVQGRNDWSSILPPDNNSYFYPGASLSWVFSDVLDLPSWVSFGRLRAGIADVGRPGPRYFANVLYPINNYGSTIHYGVPGDLPPVNLKPERKRELELGTELRFLKNRLGLEVSYFHSRTYNQIMGLSVPPSSGVNNVRVNAGEIRQNGLEIQLRGTPIQSQNLQWDVILNTTSGRPMIHELSSGITTHNLWGATGASVVAEEGKPWGQIVINDWERHSETGERIVGDNGLYSDSGDEIVVGNVLPDFYGGLTNTINYKNMSLDFGIDFQFGGTLISQTNMYMIGNGTAASTLEYRNEEHGGLPYYVDNDGNFNLLDNHAASAPDDSRFSFIFHDGVILEGIKEDGSPNDQVISSADYYSYYWRSFLDIQPDVVYKSDFIKLRNIVFSYDLNMDGLMGIGRLRLYTFANNLFYLHNTMPNVDPEALNATNSFTENSGWPMARSYGFGVRANF